MLRSYATYLASWGFAVLQYDVPLVQSIADTEEVISELFEVSITFIIKEYANPSVTTPCRSHAYIRSWKIGSSP